MVKTYRLKDNTKALIWDGENKEEVREFTGDRVRWLDEDLVLWVRTIEGVITSSVGVGDFIFIQDGSNEYGCMEADIFNSNYEEIK